MRSRSLRVLLALTVAISGATFIDQASATADYPITLCEAGMYGSLSKVLTKGDAAVVQFAPQGSETSTYIAAESPVEAIAFVQPGINLIAQTSPAAYTAAQGRLRLAIDSVKTNLLPSAYTLTSTSMGIESIAGGLLGHFTPGIYATPAGMNIAANETITLTGGPTDRFVFISRAALVLGAGVTMVLSGGVQAKNVYWVIGADVGDQTAGAGGSLVGNILVDGSITVGAGVHINGRILAVNTITYGAGSQLNVLPSNTSCGSNTGVKSILFTKSTLSEITAGVPYSDSITAVSYVDNVADGASITYSVSTPLPSGLTLNSSTGLVSGTLPETTTAGDVSLSFMAFAPSISSPPVIAILKVKAKPVKSILFIDKTLLSAVRGSPYSDTITAIAKIDTTTSAAVITYSVSSGSLPAGITLNTSTGSISGTPTTLETKTVVITAASGGYLSQSETITITVKASIVSEIVFTDLTLVDATIGTFYSDTATAEARVDGIASGATITYTLDSLTPLPTGLTLNSLNGVVSGTLPDETTAGDREVTIIASSGLFTPQSLLYRYAIKPKVLPDNTAPYVPPAGGGGGGFVTTPVTTPTLETVTALTETPTVVVDAVPALDPILDATDVDATDTVPSSPVTASNLAKKPINTLMMTAFFANNSSQLNKKTQVAIKVMAGKLKKMKIAKLTVAGFASATGSVDNLRLSLVRAKTLAGLLVTNGVKTKIVVKGLGVLPSNGSKSALALTRKAEIWLLLKA